MFSRKQKDNASAPMTYVAAKEVACQVFRLRNGIAAGRDSDGNTVTVKYSNESIMEEAAIAASSARDLQSSASEMERVFCEAEELVSDAVHTS